MKVEFSPSLKKRTIEFCDDELNYHINDSGCAWEYHNEITSQIEILVLLGEKDMAEGYADDYMEYLKEELEDTYYSDVKKNLKSCIKSLEKLTDSLFNGA